MDSRMIDSIVEMKMEEWRKLIYDPKLTPFENDLREMEDQMTRLEALVEKRTSKLGTIQPEEPPGPAVYAVPYGIVTTVHFNQISKSTKMSSTARLLPVRHLPVRLFLFFVEKGKKSEIKSNTHIM